MSAYNPQSTTMTTNETGSEGARRLSRVSYIAPRVGSTGPHVLPQRHPHGEDDENANEGANERVSMGRGQMMRVMWPTALP